MEVTGPSYLLREAVRPAERDGAMSLLETAGWSPGRLAHWAASGTVLELYDPADSIPRGAAIVAPTGNATYALHAWATTLDMADRAVAGRLVRAIAEALRRSGARRVVASVEHADRRSIMLLLEAEPVKPVETTCYADLMSASGVGSLIQATVGSFGGSGRRCPNRAGFAA
jgi:uncharacterized protein YqgV (UPF0045/DUF77 family)